MGGWCPPCASSEIVQDGVNDSVSGASQVIADNQAEDLSALSGLLHGADVLSGEGIGSRLADGIADHGQGGGADHRGLFELRSV